MYMYITIFSSLWSDNYHSGFQKPVTIDIPVIPTWSITLCELYYRVITDPSRLNPLTPQSDQYMYMYVNSP